MGVWLVKGAEILRAKGLSLVVLGRAVGAIMEQGVIQWLC